jgi:hypothetical protein
LVAVQVTFYKLVEQRRSYWEAVGSKRVHIAGSGMALGRGDMPHDLIQLVAEATLEIEYGFWGCVAAGGTFRSMARKQTRPGRAVIAAHRGELDAAEKLVGVHVNRWTAGLPTPVAVPLKRMDPLWQRLGDSEGLTVIWPSLRVMDSLESASTPT